MSLQRAKAADPPFRDAVFGYIRRYEKTETCTVPLLVRYLCLTYYLLEDYFARIAVESQGVLTNEHRKVMNIQKAIAINGHLPIYINNPDEGVSEYQWKFEIEPQFNECTTRIHFGLQCLQYRLDFDWMSFVVNEFATENLYVSFNVQLRTITLEVMEYYLKDTKILNLSRKQGRSFSLFLQSNGTDYNCGKFKIKMISFAIKHHEKVGDQHSDDSDSDLDDSDDNDSDDDDDLDEESDSCAVER